MRTRLAVAFALVATASEAWAQAPVVNANVETRAVAQGLAREVQRVIESGNESWVGYRVPIAPRQRETLSDTGTLGRCRLEPPTELAVFARVQSRRIVSVRASGVDCDLDGGGMPVVWLTGVAPDDSVTWLTALLDDPTSSRALRESALTGVGLHAAPSAANTLIRLARDSRSTDVRSKALFWLAQRASDRAVATIKDAIANDPEIEVKKRAVFALSQLPRDESVTRLMEVATTSRVAEVRRQAMFWLGQSKDPRAVDFFEKILR
jgi:hypothetical protein